MPFTLAQFAAIRPFLFHLTAQKNLPVIRRESALLPAAELFRRANGLEWMRTKRPEHVELSVHGDVLAVRDQAPLYEGNIHLTDGWIFGDFVEHLNKRVFFWPGHRSGLPMDYGMRHYERYAREAIVILRIPTTSLFGANEAIAPEFCRYNSGSPRCSGGKRSPRGAETFLACDRTEFTACEAIEVTFAGKVVLPAGVEMTHTLPGSWTAL